MKNYLLKGATVCIYDRLLENVAIVIRNGFISQLINEEDSLLPNDLEHIQLPNDSFIIPGFIDVHIHGANGADVMDASFEALDTIASTLLKQGTTGFLATTMTASCEDINSALVQVAEYKQKRDKKNASQILGVHLEGPFISGQKIGAQNSTWLADPNVELFKQWQLNSNNIIKKVTIAPEIPGSNKLIQYLSKQNIIASIGHTNCSAEIASEAIESGVSSATHLYNAMSGLNHREPGAAAAILLADDVSAELIVDGVHLSEAITQLTLKIKGSDRILLITDAMRAQGYGSGVFELGGQKVIVKGNEARLENGVLAGSVLNMNKAIINMMKFTQCSLVDAVKMASFNPARQIGVDRFMGSIACGKLANLVVLDSSYNVQKTFIADYQNMTL